jgi:hypothetical protein
MDDNAPAKYVRSWKIAWRNKSRFQQEQDQAERQLVVENARLKRQLAEQAEK